MLSNLVAPSDVCPQLYLISQCGQGYYVDSEILVVTCNYSEAEVAGSYLIGLAWNMVYRPIIPDRLASMVLVQ